MRGEGSAARLPQALIEHRFAPVPFDAGGGLRLRPETADDPAHDSAEGHG